MRFMPPEELSSTEAELNLMAATSDHGTIRILHTLSVSSYSTALMRHVTVPQHV